jgi:indolepyruvate ferredoxin oxidoreductase beta subunit
MNKSILMVGVGGQGTILASKLLTIGLMEAGYDVKMSEIHGMSQRGGSVSSQIRYGEKVYSPVIEIGSADLIIAFEKLEALRSLEYLKPQGKVIVNDYRIDPMSVLGGYASYPENVLDILKAKTDLTVLNATAMAEELGNIRVMNIILLGSVANRMGLGEIDWNEIIAQNVKKQFVEINQKAFELGYRS